MKIIPIIVAVGLISNIWIVALATPRVDSALSFESEKCAIFKGRVSPENFQGAIEAQVAVECQIEKEEATCVVSLATAAGGSTVYNTKGSANQTKVNGRPVTAVTASTEQDAMSMVLLCTENDCRGVVLTSELSDVGYLCVKTAPEKEETI